MASSSLTVDAMDGQVLGGGVIVLVAVALWLMYLLPSWYSRHQYNAAERNALRLNQALRILAETSETPQEVRFELNARTALAQQRLARRAQAEREELAKKAQAEREAIVRRTQAERDELARREIAERELAELERRRAALEEARRERSRARSLPEARRARSRKRARRMIAVVWLAALVLVGGGTWLAMTGLTTAPLWAGVALVVAGLTLTTCAARVRVREAARARAAVRVEAAPVTAPAPEIMEPERGWSPRELPRPLTASAGSRAAAVLDGADARETLRRAALEESIRERAERRRPPSIDTAARASRSAEDEEIEAHVRDLLARRAVGA